MQHKRLLSWKFSELIKQILYKIHFDHMCWIIIKLGHNVGRHINWDPMACPHMWSVLFVPIEFTLGQFSHFLLNYKLIYVLWNGSPVPLLMSCKMIIKAHTIRCYSKVHQLWTRRLYKIDPNTPVISYVCLPCSENTCCLQHLQNKYWTVFLIPGVLQWWINV